jgi:hypothetical protein
MKKTLLAITLLVSGFAAKAQTVFFRDTFEQYNTGGFLAQQAGSSSIWGTWSNQPGGAEDAKISEDFALSGTKSLKIDNGSDDIILKLGNKTSGKFNLTFNYFLPTGFGGYFNLQHFQNPGIQWATEVYFGNNGQGNIKAQNITTNFTHPNNAWVKLETIVDMDIDSAWFYVDGNKIVQWKFSTQAGGQAGANQLGSINFYGGSISGQTPKYYVDDVSLVELVQPAAPPTIGVNQTVFNTSGFVNETITVSNTGDQDLSFSAYPTYPYSANNVQGTQSIVELTHTSGPIASGLGGFSSDINIRSASLFLPQHVKPVIGQTLNSVSFAINDLPRDNAATVLVYERGSSITPGPGNLIDSIQVNFTAAGEQQDVPLTNPIYLDGKDIWIGYRLVGLASTYPIGLDAGPRVNGVNWLSTGPGWTEMNSAVNNNIFVVGVLTGNPIVQWLTVSPSSGTILPGQSQNLTLSFDASGLVTGNYKSIVEIPSNDPNAEYKQVEVNLSVVTGLTKASKIGVITYPNPSTQFVNVQADANIETISIYNVNGSIVKTININAKSTTVNVSDLAKGNYLMNINVGNNTVVRKVVVE